MLTRSFADQLASLTGTELTPVVEPDSLSSVEQTVEDILAYFERGRQVLGGLDAQDDAEWMFEGRQAILEVGKTILRAGDVMSQLMTILETTTKSSQLYPIVEKIERAIGEWHEILGAIQAVRYQVDVATEWKEFNDQIFSEVQNELDECCEVVFEIEERRHFPDDKSRGDTNIDTLSSALEESPFLGHARLPSMSDAERQVNNRLIELAARVRPLGASLSFIPLRLEQYSLKAKDLFPGSIKMLENKYTELHERWNQLNNDIKTLEKELGEDRWCAIFRNTGRQAAQMLDTFEENLSLIAKERRVSSNGGSNEASLQRLERYLTKNMYLVPAIQRIMALFDRAMKDRLTFNGEIVAMQSELHRRWSVLSGLHETYNLDSPVISSRSFDSSISSVRSSSSSYASSASFVSNISPISSVTSSPTLQPTGFKSKHPRTGSGSIDLESCESITTTNGHGAAKKKHGRAGSIGVSLLPVHKSTPPASEQQLLIPPPPPSILMETPTRPGKILLSTIPSMMDDPEQEDDDGDEDEEGKTKLVIPKRGHRQNYKYSPPITLHHYASIDTLMSAANSPNPNDSNAIMDNTNKRLQLDTIYTTPRHSFNRVHDTPIPSHIPVPKSTRYSMLSSPSTIRRPRSLAMRRASGPAVVPTTPSKIPRPSTSMDNSVSRIPQSIRRPSSRLSDYSTSSLSTPRKPSLSTKSSIPQLTRATKSSASKIARPSTVAGLYKKPVLPQQKQQQQQQQQQQRERPPWR
ncbi:hypothetical protein TRVA0_030S00496 [Trichomonascus vanleenenianus]|uniref:Kar9p n=1 Tax=Trichomonascus vanleenenianus TaxID=2268995 RepID=UPI003EC97662